MNDIKEYAEKKKKLGSHATTVEIKTTNICILF